MKFTEDLSTKTLNAIQSYGKDHVVIQQHHIDHSIIVSPSLLNECPIKHIDELSEQTLAVILEHNPEIIILGTGEKQDFPKKETIRLLIKEGIGYEVMDTMAACRTYNILISEGRQAVALLIL